MTSIFRGQRPDITPAQVVGVLIAGVPVIASLLRAFAVYDLSPDQQEALRDALVWCGVTAGVLFASDAGLRAARNAADARRDSAALSAPATPHTEVPEAHDSGPRVDEAASAAFGQEFTELVGPESGSVPDAPDVIR